MHTYTQKLDFNPVLSPTQPQTCATLKTKNCKFMTMCEPTCELTLTRKQESKRSNWLKTQTRKSPLFN